MERLQSREEMLTQTASFVLLGTMASNNKSVPMNEREPDWLAPVQEAVEQATGMRVANPNVGSDGIRDFPMESMQLFNSIPIMNFESTGGRTSLTELRLAILSSALSGRPLIVNFEEPKEDDIRTQSSRWLIQTDLTYFEKLFGPIDITNQSSVKKW